MRQKLTYLGLFLNITLLLASEANSMEMTMMPRHNAPVGIMGDHLVMEGKWMFSARLHHMVMKGNQLDGDSISDTHVLQETNPYASAPNMPMKLSVVPQDMTMNMLMIGAMYAPSSEVTLMGMAMYSDKNMELDTYQGMMGRNYLGSFDTSSSDLSHVSITALYKLYKTPKHRAHLHLGLAKGVGDNDVDGAVLTPMNTRATMTLPYGMQVSDRASRLTLGVTNVSKLGDYELGSQLLFNKTIADQDWTFGDQCDLNTWVQRDYNHDLSFSARLHYKSQKQIDGRDQSIMAPVQTANPYNYGGQSLDFALGANVALDIFGADHNRIGLEVVLPVRDNKRGLQMESDWSLIVGYKTSF